MRGHVFNRNSTRSNVAWKRLCSSLWPPDTTSRRYSNASQSTILRFVPVPRFSARTLILHPHTVLIFPSTDSAQLQPTDIDICKHSAITMTTACTNSDVSHTAVVTLPLAPVSNTAVDARTPSLTVTPPVPDPLTKDKAATTRKRKRNALFSPTPEAFVTLARQTSSLETPVAPPTQIMAIQHTTSARAQTADLKTTEQHPQNTSHLLNHTGRVDLAPLHQAAAQHTTHNRALLFRPQPLPLLGPLQPAALLADPSEISRPNLHCPIRPELSPVTPTALRQALYPPLRPLPHHQSTPNQAHIIPTFPCPPHWPSASPPTSTPATSVVRRFPLPHPPQPSTLSEHSCALTGSCSCTCRVRHRSPHHTHTPGPADAFATLRDSTTTPTIVWTVLRSLSTMSVTMTQLSAPNMLTIKREI
ncbi:mucin-2-like [Schistocerca serialis cubense]|uniref:mucin-2-like n=1 Tax=Schistocerca serialis cubense TaxID=2023355 RepID=UPI00214F21CF|nr:mucin-2-like [Schistocerca serialis cubense]